MFPIYNHKITKTNQYKYVYSGNKRKTNNNFIVYYRENNQQYPYFGISISRKIGNSVRRHLIKRWILEGLKQTGHLFNPHYNYIFVVKASNEIHSLSIVVNNQKFFSNNL